MRIARILAATAAPVTPMADRDWFIPIDGQD
jgi:hypothetical protein